MKSHFAASVPPLNRPNSPMSKRLIKPLLLTIATLGSAAAHAAEYYQADFDAGSSDWQSSSTASAGDWAIIDTSGPSANTGYTPIQGTGYLDANPNNISQGFRSGVIEQTTGIELPATASNVHLSYRYQLQLIDNADRVSVELENSQSPGTWTPLKTYTNRHNHSRHNYQNAGHSLSADDGSGHNWATQTLALSGYQGQTLRLRFRYAYRGGTTPRHFALDALRIADPLDGQTPLNPNNAPNNAAYSNALTSLAERSAWRLNGDWSARSQTDTDGTTRTVLDANPSGRIQAYQSGYAQLSGTLHIPSNATSPVLQLTYRGQLIHRDDALRLELRSVQNPAWQAIAQLNPHASDRDQQHEQTLEAYRGQDIQLRLGYRYWGSYQARSLQISALSRPTVQRTHLFKKPLIF